MDKVLVFEISSKMAHFRKFYTNSSSLSYFFPPKTVISGMIAGFLGYQRDTYYELFDEKAKISVEIVNALRKKIQVVNYLFVKSITDLRGFSGGTQVPLEFVLPADFSKEVSYRIYFYHELEEIYNELRSTLENSKYRYPLYMGLSELPATAKYIGEFSTTQVNTEETIEISSVIPADCVLGISKIMYKNQSVYKDKMPVEFTKERKLKKVKDYIFNPNGEPISTKVSNPIYQVNQLNKNIVLM